MVSQRGVGHLPSLPFINSVIRFRDLFRFHRLSVQTSPNRPHLRYDLRLPEIYTLARDKFFRLLFRHLSRSASDIYAAHSDLA